MRLAGSVVTVVSIGLGTVGLHMFSPAPAILLFALASPAVNATGAGAGRQMWRSSSACNGAVIGTSMEGMIAMAVIHGDYIPVSVACAIAGVNGTYIRRELRKHLNPETGMSEGGKVSGYQVTERTWLVRRSDIEQLAKTLSWKAGRPRDAKKPGRRRSKKSA